MATTTGPVPATARRASGPASARARRALPRGALGISAALAALVLGLVAIAGPLVFGPRARDVDLAERLRGASTAHPFGTDELGRDIAARVLAAGGTSIGLALAAAAVALVTGLLLGVTPVVLGPRLRRVIVAATEIALAFPWLLMAMFIAVVWGGGRLGPVLAVGLSAAPAFARLAYTLASGVAGRDYVRAARVLGVGRARVLARHVLPNIAEPLIVFAAAATGGMLLSFSVLSFLGIGLQPPSVDWGRLFNEGMQRAYVSPMAALGPGLAIVLAGLAFTLIGEALSALTGVRSPGTAVLLGLRPVRTGVPLPSPAVAGAPAPTGAPGSVEAPVLSVRGLTIRFPGGAGPVVDDVSFDVAPGEVVGVVGESGSGKTLTALACTGLLDERAEFSADRLEFAGRPVPRSARADRATRHRLGTSLAMVFQDPSSALNPALRVGTQLAEVSRTHLGRSRRQSWQDATERLGEVGIDRPGLRARQYPHQLSGGMRQRAQIGIGLMSTPRLIVADEPTTALDVTVQRRVVELLHDARRRTGAAVLFISHDIALVSAFCDRVLVMRDGRLLEDLPVADLRAARHPYTRALLACVPDMTTPTDRPLPTVPDELDDRETPAGPDGLDGLDGLDEGAGR